MRVYTKYRGLQPRKRWRNSLYLFMALAGMVVLVWVFWEMGRPEKQPASPSRSPIPSNPSTPATKTGPFRATVSATNPEPRLLLSNRVPSAVVTTAAPPAQVAAPANESALTPPFEPRTVRNVLEAQIALARERISAGSIDGQAGAQTRLALMAYQEKMRLPATGVLDSATRAELRLASPPLTNVVVSQEDLAGLQPVPSTWLGKSQQTRLGYETILELVAEKGQAHPNLIRRLNPAIDWDTVTQPLVAQIPEVSLPAPRFKAAFLRINLSDRTLQAFDSSTNLLAHFPCSIARRMDKRPVGSLYVASVVLNPNYVFDPEVFPESEEGRQLGHKLVLPAGPNGPVGEVWIGLDKPGYGIHGTPHPEAVGRTESHGCFRLANWNAESLAQLVKIGTLVLVCP